MAVVEVQRYWNRFKQLGCDKNGFISASVLEKGELNSDVMIRNVSRVFLINLCSKLFIKFESI